jgi:hypothetical protein
VPVARSYDTPLWYNDQDADRTTARQGHNLAIVRDASVAFRELAATRPPAELTSTQREAYEQQTDWLRGAVVELDELARQAERLIGQMELLNMQFLELQDAVQKESSKFQNLSNASKARHEIIMNAIALMKA